MMTPSYWAASAASGVALLRAVMCPAGVEQMRADAEFVVASEPPWSSWRPVAVAVLGFAHVLAGDGRRAEEILAGGLPETVKTQAISIYRKLDTSSRGEAVARARDIGLLDEFVRDVPAASQLR